MRFLSHSIFHFTRPFKENVNKFFPQNSFTDVASWSVVFRLKMWPLRVGLSSFPTLGTSRNHLQGVSLSKFTPGPSCFSYGRQLRVRDDSFPISVSDNRRFYLAVHWVIDQVNGSCCANSSLTGIQAQSPGPIQSLLVSR